MPAEKAHELWPFTSQEARERYLAHYDAMEASWPIDWENRTVHTDHGETFLRISGPVDAPPLVLLPGGQSTSLVWRRLIEPLSARFRTYALDSIYDAGRSVPARPMKDVAELTTWLDDVLDALGLTDRIRMMGISYGAYVVAEYALHAPQRLGKIVWVSPVLVAAPLSQEFVNRLRPCAEPGREPIEAFCRWVMPSLTALDTRAFDSRVDEILLSRECYGPRIPPVRVPVLSDDELKSIDVPALYILGEEDGATENPREVLARLGVVAPRIETMLIPGAGHDAVVAEPKLIADRVLRFLGDPNQMPERFDLQEIEPQPWKNGAGVTREIAASPSGADASAFDWRISVAEIERDGPFSLYPGIDRTIVLLRGTGLLLREPDGGPMHPLTRWYQPLDFSGDRPIEATLLGGPSTDFNVMTRRGRSRAEVTVLKSDARLPQAAAGLVFCCEGIWQVEGPASWVIGPWQGLLWREGRPQLTFRSRSRVDACLLVVDLLPASS